MKKYMLYLLIMVSFFSRAAGQKVEIKSDKKTDISKFHSFRIQEGEIVLVLQTEVDERVLKQEIAKSIESNLIDKGYRKQQDSLADFTVTFVAEILERVEQEQLGPLGQTPARSGADLDQKQTWTQEVRTGSLAMEVTNTAGQSIWRSSSSINFRSSELGEVLQAAVSRGLRKFPKAKK